MENIEVSQGTVDPEDAKAEITAYMEMIPDDVARQSRLEKIFVGRDDLDIRDEYEKLSSYDVPGLEPGEQVMGFYDRDRQFAAFSLEDVVGDRTGEAFFHEYGHSLEGMICSPEWNACWDEWRDQGQSEGFADLFGAYMMDKLARNPSLVNSPDWWEKWYPRTYAYFKKTIS